VTSPEALLLNTDILCELERRWRAQGAPLLPLLRRGLDDEEIDAVTARVGIRLPREPRIWWGWHDGTEAGQRSLEERYQGPGLPLLTLAESVVVYQQQSELAGWAGSAEQAEEPSRWWHPQWFPVTEATAGGVVAVDCGVGLREPCPIRMVSWGTNEESDVPVARSFGEMVTWWIEAFDTGAWSYDATRERWQYDTYRIAEGRQLKKVV
jgi:cell wall assembly regulator SMI1